MRVKGDWIDMLPVEVEDELSALEAIYGPCISVTTDSLPLVVNYSEGGVTARFTLPVGYPEQQSPQMSLHLRDRNDPLSRLIANSIDELLQSEHGRVCLFPVIEMLRLMIEEGCGQTAVKEEESCQCNAITDADRYLNKDIGLELAESVNIDMPISVHHGAPLVDRGSTFIGHVARVSSMQEVLLFRQSVLSDRKVCIFDHWLYTCMHSAYSCRYLLLLTSGSEGYA